MTRIKYNKEKLPSKQYGGGGPRDRQAALKLRQQAELLQRVSPTISAEVSKQPSVDLSQYLPFEEVKKKIEEAVASTAEAERKRFESGLKNLNDQLNVERKKVGATQDQLINANAEVAKLKIQINKFPEVSEKAQQLINEKELDVSKLKAELVVKSELYDRAKTELPEIRSKLSAAVEMGTEKQIKIVELEANLKAKEEVYLQSSQNLEELKSKLDKLYDRIADGSIKPLVGSKMDRPALEDKIFIDPLEKDTEPDLDSHINVEEDKASKETSERDINTDLAKLRNLLKL
jgi:chromosome segregation ATPase